MLVTTDINGLTKGLVSGLADGYDDQYGLGSMTCAIYDTAWVSMVSKAINGKTSWLFPRCFELIVKSQRQDGGWDGHATDKDEIINTAAALLALCRHSNEDTTAVDMGSRIERATQSLHDSLQRLNLEDTLPVGFEMILPAILGYLEKESIFINFPAKRALFKIREKKMAHVDLGRIYEGGKSTILHSLEAFIGEVDFDQVRQHTVQGSLMGSPSSTAAYLMNASAWDNESEKYLHQVVEVGAGKGDGGVPSAYPSTHFEISWIISTLLENGFSVEDLGTRNTDLVKKILSDAFRQGQGIIGFAPSLEPDADDTAKGIITLNLLGVSTSALRLVEEYKNHTHFRTYRGERDPSVTTNSNVLTALCTSSDVASYKDAIETATGFLCTTWFRDASNIRDKWNVSQNYTLMLMTHALCSVLTVWSEGVLEPDRQLLQDILVVLFQIVLRLLRSQGEDGSWDDKRETTAYAIIAINATANLPMLNPAREQIDLAMQRGKGYLHSGLAGRPQKPEHIWIEKVTYGSHNLSQAFTLSALRCSPRPCPSRVAEILPEPVETTLKWTKFFGKLPLFRDTPIWLLEASALEGSLLRDRLRERCLRVFPTRTSTKEKHMAFIPFTWTAGNNMHGGALGSDTLVELMVISALAYQVDEVIETGVADMSIQEVRTLKSSIGSLFAQVEGEEQAMSKGRDDTDGTNEKGSKEEEPQDGAVAKMQRGLVSFMRYLWHSPHVRAATPYNRAQLKRAMKAYLTAHLTQAEDNHALASQSPRLPSSAGDGSNSNSNSNLSSNRGGGRKIYESATTSLHGWTHSTSGDHTAGPVAVAAFFCMLGGPGGADRLPSARAKYVAEDMSRRLAALCRLYNDYGSVARDRDECNLNSVNFPEFSLPAAVTTPHGARKTREGEQGHDGDADDDDDASVKAELLQLAEYERRCLVASLAELRPLVGEDVFATLSIFYNSADMYGQMYVLKDMTPSVKKGARGEEN